VDVSKVVDQKANRHRTASCVVSLRIGIDRAIERSLLVARCVVEPGNDGRDGDADVLFVKLEIGVVIGVAALVEEGNIDEVPVGLPSATAHLNVVRVGRALHEGMVQLTDRVGLAFHDLQQIFDLGDHLWALLHQHIVGKPGNYKIRYKIRYLGSDLGTSMREYSANEGRKEEQKQLCTSISSILFVNYYYVYGNFISEY